MKHAESIGELQRRVALRPALAVVLELAFGLALSAWLLWAFAELSEGVLEGESRRFDRVALLWVEAAAPGWLDGPLRLVTSLGYFRVVLPLSALAALLFYRAGSRASAALIFVSTAGGILLNTVLKAAFRRDRPTLIDSGYESSFFSFPSGHATVAVSFYGALALLLALRLHGARRWLWLAAGAVWALLMGFSRVYLGVHYPTDVLAGYLSALTWLAFVCLALRIWQLRDGLDPPGARKRPARRSLG